MQTRRIRIDPADYSLGELEPVVEILREGGIVGLPTETVYGLGVDAENPEALGRLREVKRRPSDKPFTRLIAEAEEIERHVEEVPLRAQLLIRRFWPGPLTIILPGKGGQDVGLRQPSHSITRDLLRCFGGGLAAPSANPSGQPAAKDALEVLEYFDDTIEAVIDAGRSTIGEASAVVRIHGEGYEILREGLISGSMIDSLLAGRNVLFVCTGNSCRSPMAAGLFGRVMARQLGVSTEELVSLGYVIHSAGTAALDGGRPSREAVEVMGEIGIDISGHRSQALTRHLAEEADRIYVMTAGHRSQVLMLDEGLEEKVEVLSPSGIPDPIGGSREEYRQCRLELEKAIEQLGEKP